MLCQRCGNNQALIPIYIIENGMKVVEYICVDCAKHEFGSNLSHNAGNSWQITPKYAGNVNVNLGELQTKALVCTSCGTTFSEFMRRGRFGCGDCYEAFQDKLIPIFNEMHFSHEYCGKIPESPGLLDDEEKMLLLMKKKEHAVAREDFKRAGELQKQIRKLKNEVGK